MSPYYPPGADTSLLYATYPGLVLGPFPILQGSTTNRTANLMYATRVVMPRKGTLHDLAIYIGAASGNAAVSVYDTGDASPTNYSQLYTSGSVATAGAGVWQVIGDPNIAVTQGQQLLICAQLDNATATTLAPAGTVGTAAGRLPTSYIPAVGGAPPQIIGTFAPGSFTQPSTIAFTGITGFTGAMVIIGRVG